MEKLKRNLGALQLSPLSKRGLEGGNVSLRTQVLIPMIYFKDKDRGNLKCPKPHSVTSMQKRGIYLVSVSQNACSSNLFSTTEEVRSYLLYSHL